jgi:hypothetical protein
VEVGREECQAGSRLEQDLGGVGGAVQRAERGREEEEESDVWGQLRVLQRFQRNGVGYVRAWPWLVSARGLATVVAGRERWENTVHENISVEGGPVISGWEPVGLRWLATRQRRHRDFNAGHSTHDTAAMDNELNEVEPPMHAIDLVESAESPSSSPHVSAATLPPVPSLKPLADAPSAPPTPPKRTNSTVPEDAGEGAGDALVEESFEEVNIDAVAEAPVEEEQQEVQGTVQGTRGEAPPPAVPKDETPPSAAEPAPRVASPQLPLPPPPVPSQTPPPPPPSSYVAPTPVDTAASTSTAPRTPTITSPPPSTNAGRRSSVASTSTVSAPGSSSLVSGILIISALESIAASKEAKKLKPLKDAVDLALATLKNPGPAASGGTTSSTGTKSDGTVDPLVIFTPLRLACETKSVPLMISALDCIGKLVSYDFFHDDEQDRNEQSLPATTVETEGEDGEPVRAPGAPVPLADLITSTICDCFSPSPSSSTSTSASSSNPSTPAAPITPHDTLLLRLLSSLLSLILSPSLSVHQSSLLKAVRTVYNVFLMGKAGVVQTVAQATLGQIVGGVFSRVELGGAIASTVASMTGSAAASRADLRTVDEDEMGSGMSTPAVKVPVVDTLEVFAPAVEAKEEEVVPEVEGEEVNGKAEAEEAAEPVTL